MDNLTIISIILTIVVYLGTRWLSEQIISPITTPVLTATIVLIIIFQLFDITVEQYAEAKDWMTFLLGPATVALAVPMYHNRSVIMDRLFPALFGIIIGSISTIISAVWISKLFRFPDVVQATSAIKAVTTPVAIEVVLIIGGDPALASAFVIIAGIIGAVIAPPLLTAFKLKILLHVDLELVWLHMGLVRVKRLKKVPYKVQFQVWRWGLRRFLLRLFCHGYIPCYEPVTIES